MEVEEDSNSPFYLKTTNDVYMVMIIGLVVFIIILVFLTIRITLKVMKHINEGTYQGTS